MHPVGREPVQLGDGELQIPDRPFADVVEGQLAVFAVRFPADGPDQAQAARTLEGQGFQYLAEVGSIGFSRGIIDAFPSRRGSWRSRRGPRSGTGTAAVASFSGRAGASGTAPASPRLPSPSARPPGPHRSAGRRPSNGPRGSPPPSRP